MPSLIKFNPRLGWMVINYIWVILNDSMLDHLKYISRYTCIVLYIIIHVYRRTNTNSMARHIQNMIFPL